MSPLELVDDRFEKIAAELRVVALESSGRRRERPLRPGEQRLGLCRAEGLRRLDSRLPRNGTVLGDERLERVTLVRTAQAGDGRGNERAEQQQSGERQRDPP